MLDQTTARMSDTKAKQLKQTVASVQLDDDPGAIAPDGTQLSAGTDDGGDWDKGLSPYEKNKRMFPNRQAPEEITNLERLNRMAGSKKSVVQDMPPYETPMQRPKQPQQEKRAIVHILKLKPEMNGRLRESDLETLRLFQRFRQLDEKDTVRLNEGLAEIGRRDKNLLYALVQKKHNPEHYPEEETWAMSNNEVTERLQALKNVDPVAAHLGNEVIGGLKSLRRPHTAGLFDKIEQAMGKRTRLEQQIYELETELNRRKNWNEVR